MHHPVMPPAQKQQIIHAGFTAIRPVDDVVRIDKPATVTTGESATMVSSLQGPPDGGWNSAGFASHAKRFSLFIFQPVHHARIT
jgi:hypothetical protein